MKQGMKRTVLILLTLSLVFGSVSFAAAEPEEKPFTHVVLGDSTCLGYALNEYINTPLENGLTAELCAGFNCIVKGSYPDRIEQYLKERYPSVKTYQYGIAGARAYEFWRFLDDTRPTDAYNNWFFETWYYDWMILNTEAAGQGLSIDEMTAYFCGMYQSAVDEADLITLELGGNDFFSWVSTAMQQGVDPELDQFYSVLFRDSRAYQARREMMDRLKGILPCDDFNLLPEDVQALLNICVAAYMDATVGTDQLIACIRERNPEAKLLLTSVFNDFRGMKLRYAQEVIPYGTLMDVMTEMANLYRSTLSPYRDEYYYVSLPEDQITLLVDEMKEPVASYTPDAENMMRLSLGAMHVDLNNVSFADAAERVRTVLLSADVMGGDCQETTAEDGSIPPNDAVISYIETGRALTEDEYQEASEYIAAACYTYLAYGCHPSTAGYLAKLPAYIDAIGSDKTPRAYNAAATVAQLHSYEDTAKEITKTVVKTVSETIRSGIRSAISKIAERRNAWK